MIRQREKVGCDAGFTKPQPAWRGAPGRAYLSVSLNQVETVAFTPYLVQALEVGCPGGDSSLQLRETRKKPMVGCLHFLQLGIQFFPERGFGLCSSLSATMENC